MRASIGGMHGGCFYVIQWGFGSIGGECKWQTQVIEDMQPIQYISFSESNQME